MTLIRKKKKKQPVIICLAVLSVIIVIVVIVFLAFNKKNKDNDEVVPEIESSMALEVLPTEQVEETTEYRGKAKEYYIDYVMIGDAQETDKFLDIRIRFPNGEDYIVLTDKNITYMTENGFYMYLDEREVHMLSSARTDVEVYGGAMLYLSSYNNKQEDVAGYPVNLFVLSIYESYFQNKEEIYNRRIQLEENLLTFMNQTLQK